MKTMIVGGGAREHAIARRLAEDSDVYAYLSNKNPAIIKMSKEHRIGKEMHIEEVAEWASTKGIELAFIGPEAPLGAGLADELLKKEIAPVGPTAPAAELETSKSFMRDLMRDHSIPGAVEYGVFNEHSDAEKFITAHDGKVAVKPVGLTGGKGVKVWGDHFQSIYDASNYSKEVIDRSIGGSNSVVVEECLVGEEFTLQTFVDGKNVIPMPLVQDHKRAYEGDRGPNTGGMGSYSMPDGLLPFIPSKDRDKALDIMKKTVEAMAEEGREYRGTLYGQFMETAQGPKVIEFNVRFGDPEAMNVLPLLKGSLTDIGWKIHEGSLGPADFEQKATVCKYIVPKGYGTSSLEGAELIVNDGLENDSRLLFYASVNEVNGRIYTTRSRSLAILGVGEEISDAEQSAEDGLSSIKGEFFARHDIGTDEAIRRKIKHMEDILG